MKKHTLPIAALSMLILILDGKTALSGAADGISLCLNTLVPSLFPFFVLSMVLTEFLSGQAIPLLRPVALWCKIPAGMESLLAIGFLGGYPVGAQNVTAAWHSKKISDIQAARMITICNNAGPSFIFGILGTMFSDPKLPWLLWVIQIISALTVGAILPGDRSDNPTQIGSRQLHITDILQRSVRVMALVCSWVVLVRMMLAFLDRWILFLLPQGLQVLLCGILELSNGCIRLATVENINLRFLLASCMLSLGGLCVMLQTNSVTDGISMHLYFPGKLLQCCISVILSSILFPVDPLFPALAAILGAGCLVSFRLFEKNSRIPAGVGV